MSALNVGGFNLTLARGKTPEEEVHRVMEAINSGYRDLMRNLPQLAVPEGKLVPVASATKLRGHIIVNG